GRIAHSKAPVFESWRDPGAVFDGHRYLGRLRLPGRYLVDGVGIEAEAGTGDLMLSRVGVFDALTGAITPVSLPATYVSDTGVLTETAATPIVRLYEVARGARAWVAEKPRVLPDDAAVVRALDLPGAIGLDPRREALMTSTDARALG